MENAIVYIKVCKDDENGLLEVLERAELEAVKEFEDEYSVGYTMYGVKWYWSHPDMQKIVGFIRSKKGGLKGLIAFGENREIEWYGSPSSIGMGVEYTFVWN